MGHYIVSLKMQNVCVSFILSFSHFLFLQKFHFRCRHFLLARLLLLLFILFCATNFVLSNDSLNIFIGRLTTKLFALHKRKLKRFTHPVFGKSKWKKKTTTKNDGIVSICCECVKEYYITSKLNAISNKYSYSCRWDFGIEHQLSAIIWKTFAQTHIETEEEKRGRGEQLGMRGKRTLFSPNKNHIR